MKSNHDDDMVLVGFVARPTGLRGDLRVKPVGELEHILKPGDHVQARIALHTGAIRVEDLTVESVEPRKGLALVHFREVEDRTQAEKLRNAELRMQRCDLPELEEGAFYEADLLGCTVYNGCGRKLGVLESVIETGANDVYRVLDGTEEFLIPALQSVIRNIDIDSKMIVVDWLEGYVEEINR